MEQVYEKILSYMRANGPSLPIQIGKVLEKDSFYAGAILSGLVAKKLVKITTARIGGSPLYYLPGQQEKLSLLYDHLPLREKEAFSLLKEKKVIREDEAPPAMRVALAMLKDFAIPFKQGATTAWRWHLAPEELQHSREEKPEMRPLIQEQQRSPQSKQQASSDSFTQCIIAYLSKNNITLSQYISQRKNREVVAEVNVPSSIGLLPMLVIGKNKKKIGDSDIVLAHQQGQARKLPTIFLTTGELTKKAKTHIEKNLKGYMVFKRVS